MNSHAREEIGFWKSLYAGLGEEGFAKLRTHDANEKTKFFPQVWEEKGKGIDVGCGLQSIFAFHPFEGSVEAIDPLMNEYKEIVSFENTDRVSYSHMSGEELTFADGSFDFALCVNVIDHTPNPKRMADEIYRVLKPGATLYFEVNFDDHLSPAHYAIWNEAMVADMFPSEKWLQVKVDKERNDEGSQYLYHVLYVKAA